MRIALYALAGWFTLSALLTISAIGKPRKPLTSGSAAVTVAILAAFVVVLVLAARGEA